MKTKTIFISIILTASLLPVSLFAKVSPETGSGSNNNKGIVLLGVETLSEKKQDVLIKTEEEKSSAKFKSNRIVVKYKNDKKPFHVVNLPDNVKILDAIKTYKSYSNVEYAEPDYIAYADITPNDTFYAYQWHMDNANGSGVNAEEAWDTSTGKGVVIAVIDTGIAYENNAPYYQAPDLSSTCFVPGYDFINNDTHPNDDNSHGTHVAGTIAQSTNNNMGTVGVAYDACLMPVKALDQYGSGSYTAIAEAIYWATNNGANVINMSLGGTYDSLILEDAVAYAYNNGVTVVAAAGNENTNTPHYPSSYNDYVISVGATDYNKDRAPYSNYGPDVDVFAPGGNTGEDASGDGYVDGVLQQTIASSSELNTFGYYFFQGTSMATPHVAGTAALIISNGKATTPDDVRIALELTAQDLGETGKDDIFGYGLIDAAAALNWGEEIVDTPPQVNLLSPLNGSTVSGEVELNAKATDDNGILRVDFSVDGTFIGTSAENLYTFVWDSSTVENGIHTITATVLDTVLQKGSSSVVVNVDNTTNKAPVADAGEDQTLSDNDGNGFEMIILDGSNSINTDGFIVSYEWREGSTIIATSSTAILNSKLGTHTYVLTITDELGASGRDDVVVTILANQAPTATAGEDQTIKLGDSAIFKGSESFDNDGTIVSYEWDFGDNTFETGEIVNHIYSYAGIYTATLTITDNGGLTSSDSTTITVSPSEIEVFYDSFEVSEWNGLWIEDAQNDWFQSSQRATDGSKAAEIDGSAKNASLTSTSINLQGKTNALITFDWLIENTLDKKEYLAFDISKDNGVTWQEYVSLKGNVDTENIWHQEKIEISNVNNIKIRFRGKMSGSDEDADIDNVRVVAR